MKLVVLGNGFDLASNLPTKYQHFFKYREKSIKDFLDKVNQEIERKHPSELSELYSSSFNDQSDRKKKDRCIRDLNNLPTTEVDWISKTIEGRCAELKKEFSDINFWDIFFYTKHEQQEQDKILWSNIEADISTFLNKNSSSGTNRMLSGRFDIEHYALWANNPLRFKDKNSQYGIFSKEVHGYIEDVLSLSDTTLKYTYIVQFCFGNYKISENTTKRLWNELEKFEINFAKYIKEINNKIFMDPAKMTSYANNLKKIVNPKNDDEVNNVLSFNYTMFTPKDDIPEDISTLMYDSVGGNSFRVRVSHVHGSIDDKIIFGIDQKAKKANDASFIFTKTYKKMLNSINTKGVLLPSKDDLEEIIFYGHSLSSADYSYFKSIFDHYDIYSENIKLIFKFSDFEGCSKEDNKLSQTLAISRLIKEYGEEMYDEKRGENLLHKLLLENRLKIELISLYDIKF